MRNRSEAQDECNQTHTPTTSSPPDIAPSDARAAMLACTRLGLPIVPAYIGKKHAAVRGWQTAGALSEDDVERLLRHPQYLRQGAFGIAVPHGAVCIDVDHLPALDALEDELGLSRGHLLYATRGAVVETPRGGLHLWFALPKGAGSIKNLAGWRPGIDVRAPGAGFAMAPGSPGYAWIAGPPLRLEQCPRELLDALPRRRAALAPTGPSGAPVPSIPVESSLRGRAAILAGLSLGPVHHAHAPRLASPCPWASWHGSGGRTDARADCCIYPPSDAQGIGRWHCSHAHSRRPEGALAPSDGAWWSWMRLAYPAQVRRAEEEHRAALASVSGRAAIAAELSAFISLLDTRARARLAARSPR